MLLEEFLKSNNVEVLKDLTAKIGSIGFYAVFLEMSQRKTDTLNFKTEQVSEKSLYQNGFTDGYKEAIFDLFYFVDRFVKPESAVANSRIRPDFGALKKLVDTKQITEEEADAIRNSRI